MLTLPVLPCADENFMVKASETKISLHDHQQEGDHHDDACSPFCHCTCCAVFSVNHYSADASLLIIQCRSYISFVPGDLFQYASPVWQPPQIG